MPDFIFQSALSAEKQRHLCNVLARHTSLEKVLLWLQSQHPPLKIIDMIQQDEFTSDILVAYEPGIILNYDCT